MADAPITVVAEQTTNATSNVIVVYMKPVSLLSLVHSTDSAAALLFSKQLVIFLKRDSIRPT